MIFATRPEGRKQEEPLDELSLVKMNRPGIVEPPDLKSMGAMHSHPSTPKRCASASCASCSSTKISTRRGGRRFARSPIDCVVPRTWVRQAERDAGDRPGLTTDQRQRPRYLEKEVKEER
jgi:hypothetical protein